jgi:hypothetical protein
MRELEADDEVDTGETLRVSYDGTTVEGVVSELKHDGDKIVIAGNDGETYILFRPWVAQMGFDFDRGSPIDGAERTRLSDDPDKIEVLDR